MRDFAESQGIEVDEGQLNTTLLMLGSFAEAIPLSLDVALVRESGAWKICDAGGWGPSTHTHRCVMGIPSSNSNPGA